jgi:plasmid stabilization system protein ParE
MNPIWSPEAIADLTALRAYIAQDDPAAAQRVALHIVSAHRRAWIDRLSALKII